MLGARPGTRIDDFFWTVGARPDHELRPEDPGPGDQLVGFAGIYQFSPEVAEISGMVHPDWRRRRIFTALLGEALSELERRRARRVLLIVHRGWAPGAALAAKLGARLEHSEHRMRQLEAPPPLPVGDPIVLRRAVPGDGADEDFVRRCLAAAFGSDAFFDRGIEEGNRLIEDGGQPVGVMRVDRDSPTVASIYGFGILPQLQGRGIGRRALVRVTAELRAEGVEEVRLEVEAENDGALRLYERCGFERMGTEDYYELLLGAESPSS